MSARSPAAAEPPNACRTTPPATATAPTAAAAARNARRSKAAGRSSPSTCAGSRSPTRIRGLPSSTVSVRWTGPGEETVSGESGAADPARPVGACSATAVPVGSAVRAGARRARSSRRSATAPTTIRARAGSRHRTGEAVAERSVSAATRATTLSTRNAPRATRGRRTPTAPATTASSATVTMTPPIRTGLSFSPNVRIANSLSGRGVASTARLPTASSGEVTPVSSAASASETATAAAPASRPAAPPRIQRWRERPRRRSGLCEVSDMPVVRYGGPAGWVRGGSATGSGRFRGPS